VVRRDWRSVTGPTRPCVGACRQTQTAFTDVTRAVDGWIRGALAAAGPLCVAFRVYRCAKVCTSVPSPVPNGRQCLD
jgi:hypothetical protein